MRPNPDEVMDRIISFYAETILPMAKGNVDAVFSWLVLMLIRGYHGAEPKNLYEANMRIHKALLNAQQMFTSAGIELATFETALPENSLSPENFPTVDELRGDNALLNEVLEALIIQIHTLKNPAPIVNTVLGELRATMRKNADSEHASVAPVIAQVMSTLP